MSNLTREEVEHILASAFQDGFGAATNAKYRNRTAEHTDRIMHLANAAELIPGILHGEQMLDSHFRGVTEKGQPFFYCPVGRIVSWSPGDHDNKWCHFEGKYVETIE